MLAGNQYPALIIFSFLLSTCNQGHKKYRISSNNSRPSINRVRRIIFLLCEIMTLRDNWTLNYRGSDRNVYH